MRFCSSVPSAFATLEGADRGLHGRSPFCMHVGSRILQSARLTVALLVVFHFSNLNSASTLVKQGGEWVAVRYLLIAIRVPAAVSIRSKRFDQ